MEDFGPETVIESTQLFSLASVGGQRQPPSVGRQTSPAGYGRFVRPKDPPGLQRLFCGANPSRSGLKPCHSQADPQRRFDTG